MDIFGKILSNFLNTVGPPMTFQFACIFQIYVQVQYWMRFKIHSWVWTEAQSVIIIIIYSMQADISNASKIKRKQWMAATLWFRSTSLKTTLISVEQESAQWNNSQVTLFTACASRSTIAQLNPLSSPLMRWYGKLPSQNHQKPESTAPDDWQHRLLFRWCKQPVQTEVQVCLKMWYSCIYCTSRNPTELLQDGLWERCHWKHRRWHKACCRPSYRVLWWCIGDHSCERRSFTNVPTFSLPMWTSHGWIQWSGASSHSVNLGQPQPLTLRCR